MKSLLQRALAREAVVRKLGDAGRARVIVLMYHDLCEDGDFANWLRVPVSEFEAQLRFLARVGTIVDPEVCRDPGALPGDRIHFVLTFDDGYLNNLRLALPVLARHRAPAAFFVSTGHMTDQEPFWSDVVTTAIQAGEVDELDLTELGLGVFRFRRGDGSERWLDVQRFLVALKGLGNEDDPTVAAVCERLRRDHAAVLERHLPRFRPLAPVEVAELAASPWCRIGSHAHHHRILTRLEDNDLAFNLEESRRRLENLVRQPVRTLAYPNGNADERVRRAAACAGYDHAYTVAPGIVTAGTAAFMLPRLGVGGVGPRWLPGYQIGRELLQDRFRRP